MEYYSHPSHHISDPKDPEYPPTKFLMLRYSGHATLAGMGNAFSIKPRSQVGKFPGGKQRAWSRDGWVIKSLECAGLSKNCKIRFPT